MTWDIDIVEMLEKIVALEFGSYHVGDNSVRIGIGTLKDAIAEIQKLRAQVTDLTRLAGCAAIGKEFSEIKKGLPFVSLWDAAGKPNVGEKS